MNGLDANDHLFPQPSYNGKQYPRFRYETHLNPIGRKENVLLDAHPSKNSAPSSTDDLLVKKTKSVLGKVIDFICNIDDHYIQLAKKASKKNEDNDLALRFRLAIKPSPYNGETFYKSSWFHSLLLYFITLVYFKFPVFPRNFFESFFFATVSFLFGIFWRFINGYSQPQNTHYDVCSFKYACVPFLIDCLVLHFESYTSSLATFYIGTSVELIYQKSIP